jgi:hypothetical protein
MQTMRKLLIYAITILIAGVIANYFNIISVPFLDLPQFTRYTDKAQTTDAQLKKVIE